MSRDNCITVDSIRSHLISILEEETSNIDFHPNDLVKIKMYDYFIHRYIDVYEDHNQENYVKRRNVIVNEILKVLKWRKEFGVNDFKSSDFPREFFEIGLVRQGILPNGDILFCIVGRKYRICSEWNKVILSGLVWYYERLEKEMKYGQKICILFDCSDCGWKQADFRLLFDGAPILIKYYLGIVSLGYYYELPWLLRPLFSLLLSVLPQQLKDVSFIVGKNDISNIMGEDNVPDILGGPLPTTYPKLPDGMSDLESVGKSRGIKPNMILKAIDLLNEAIQTE